MNGSEKREEDVEWVSEIFSSNLLSLVTYRENYLNNIKHYNILLRIILHAFTYSEASRKMGQIQILTHR